MRPVRMPAACSVLPCRSKGEVLPSAEGVGGAAPGSRWYSSARAVFKTAPRRVVAAGFGRGAKFPAL